MSALWIEGFGWEGISSATALLTGEKLYKMPRGNASFQYLHTCGALFVPVWLFSGMKPSYGFSLQRDCLTRSVLGIAKPFLLARKTTPVVSPPALGGTDTTAHRNSHRFHATDFPLPSRLSGRRSAPYWPAAVSHCGRPGNAHWGGRGRAFRFRLGARGPRRRCHERRCRAHAGCTACAAGAARAGRGAGGCGRPPQAVGFLSAREPHPERHGAHLQACTGLLLLPGSACRASVSLWEPEAPRAAEVRRGVALFASLPPDRPGGASGRGAGGAPSPGLRNRWWLGAASARRRAVACGTVCGSGNVGDKSWGWNALCGVSAVNQIRAVFENIESYYVNVRPLTLFF